MNIIKKRRIDLGMSQYDLSRITGIHQSRLSLVENGYRKLRDDEIKILSKKLQISEQDFYYDQLNKD